MFPPKREGAVVEAPRVLVKKEEGTSILEVLVLKLLGLLAVMELSSGCDKSRVLRSQNSGGWTKKAVPGCLHGMLLIDLETFRKR